MQCITKKIMNITPLHAYTSSHYIMLIHSTFEALDIFPAAQLLGKYRKKREQKAHVLRIAPTEGFGSAVHTEVPIG